MVLVWLYLLSAALLLGAELNAILAERAGATCPQPGPPTPGAMRGTEGEPVAGATTG